MNTEAYETLPTASIGINMMAGACAGIMEHCVMYSVDSVKTRRQIPTTGSAGGGGIFTEIRNMIRQEGMSRPFRGISAMMIGAGPAHAMYFSCYEYIKEIMMNSERYSSNNHLVYACAGILSTVLHDGVMNPAEVVKQRMQMPKSPFRSSISCIRHVYATEGVAAFYRSYRTTLLMNVPFQSVHFVTYEFMQSITNEQRMYNPMAHVVSGAMAGAVAATISMPLDVCKTLLNTQIGEIRASGMVHALKLVYRYWGLSGYFRGLSARVVYQMPATAICWSTYEFFKYLLHQMKDESKRVVKDDMFPIHRNFTNKGGVSSSSFQGAGLLFSSKPSTPVLFDVTRN